MKLTDLLVQRLPAPVSGQKTYFDDMKGFGVRVSQGGAKSFVVVKGAERKLTTLGRYPALSLKDARASARKVLAETGHSSSFIRKSFPEAVLSFLGAKKRKPATVRLYTTYLNFFAWKKPVHLITKADVQTKLRELDGKDTAQNCAVNILRTFFLWCVAEEIIEKNPMGRMQPPNKVKSRERVLSDDELKKIWAVTDYPYGRLVRVLMLTGARREEIARYGKGETYLHFDDTKNGRSHRLPITPLVLEQLPVNSKVDWSTEKKRLDKLCGVSAWRLHDLRRTFSTNCARLKVPIHITEKILNHVQGTISPLAAVYCRYDFEEEVKEALLTHEAFVLGLVRNIQAVPAAPQAVESSPASALTPLSR